MGNLIKLNFELKNDSKISGDEVFQVYIKDIDASFRTPNSSLIFFMVASDSSLEILYVFVKTIKVGRP